VSSVGLDTRTLWYLSRGTGMVTLMLLTLTLVLGIAAMREGRLLGAPRFVLSGLHRNLSLLVVAFVSVHIATSVIDPFVGIRLIDAVVPFVSPYRTVWIGLGAVAIDLSAAVIITSLARVRLGLRAWRAVHWAVYVIWPVAVVHAIGTGSDLQSGLLPLVVAVCTALVIGACGLRVLTADIPAWQRGAWATAGAAVMLAVTAWTVSGPLQTGWARSASIVLAGHP
jgi:sulfoxide reductase heme-binding subunit YedZ